MLVLSRTGVWVTMTRVAGASHWIVRHGLATVPTTNGQPAMVAWSETSRTGALSAITLDWLGTKLTGAPCGQVAWVAEVSR